MFYNLEVFGVLWGKFNPVKLSGTVEITGQLLNLNCGVLFVFVSGLESVFLYSWCNLFGVSGVLVV